MAQHILIVADGRSPTTKSWIKNIHALGFTVSLISTFNCDPPDSINHFYILPVAFSRFSTGGSSTSGQSQKSKRETWVRRLTPLLQVLRYVLGPLTLPMYARKYRKIVETIQPDLVHALRIPFEGMLASMTPKEFPLSVATWGNDLTLHARGSFLMRWFTRRSLKRTDGLTSDTLRDIRLAQMWGFDSTAPSLVVPGSGGVNLVEIQKATGFNPHSFNIPETKPWVVNPRGVRPGSVHQDVFIKAIPKVLESYPETIFICPSLAGSDQVNKLIITLGINDQIYLLPKLSQRHLWSLFNEAAVYVSPSSHDGTPNTLLEAMACSCFPVVGDIESMREWIIDGKNGLLVNPHDPDGLANAILRALEQPALRESAAVYNQDLIETKAAQSSTQPKIKTFYNHLLSKTKPST
ncbi:MAG: glycosyltransferase [Chloroflexota bacterium]|nr:glycosyltransferase [Chloroflexota bacterium]